MYTCSLKEGTTPAPTDVKRTEILAFQANEADRETGKYNAWQAGKLGTRYLGHDTDGRHIACHIQ